MLRYINFMCNIDLKFCFNLTPLHEEFEVSKHELIWLRCHDYKSRIDNTQSIIYIYCRHHKFSCSIILFYTFFSIWLWLGRWYSKDSEPMILTYYLFIALLRLEQKLSRSILKNRKITLSILKIFKYNQN